MPLAADRGDQGANILDFPNGKAAAQFDWWGVSAGFDAGVPLGAADRQNTCRPSAAVANDVAESAKTFLMELFHFFNPRCL
jgi:hypothetical protein